MKVTNEELETVLPILLREQRARPNVWLEPLLARMVAEAHRRELIALLALLELQAQSEAPPDSGASGV